MSDFARPFKVSNLPGFLEGHVMHGVQFPDGRCVLALTFGGFDGATAFEHLPLPPEAVVEWADAVDESNRKIVGLNDAIERATALNRLLGQS